MSEPEQPPPETEALAEDFPLSWSNWEGEKTEDNWDAPAVSASAEIPSQSGWVDDGWGELELPQVLPAQVHSIEEDSSTSPEPQTRPTDDGDWSQPNGSYEEWAVPWVVTPTLSKSVYSSDSLALTEPQRSDRLCRSYAKHGHCRRGESCTYAHDDVVPLDLASVLGSALLASPEKKCVEQNEDDEATWNQSRTNNVPEASGSSKSSALCEFFGQGYCNKGNDCFYQHVDPDSSRDAGDNEKVSIYPQNCFALK